MIVLEDICKTYHLGENAVYALQHVNLHVESREFVAIVGPSGSGKSTLMNMIGCLDVPDSGRYCLDGEDVSSLTEKQLSTLRNRKIGFVFQQFNLLQKLSAEENVELPLIYQGVSGAERKQRVRQALAQVGLETRMHHKPHELSGGQQQRVAIARALVTRPALILADEPTGNLDSQSGREVMQMLQELNAQGHTIVLITHDQHVAEQARRRARIADGRLYEQEAAQ